jgi:tripartite-type tricarboxylate transporter receptor subunit TctC
LTDRSSINKVGLCFLIRQDIAKAINVADARARMEQQGAVPLTITPEQFDVIIRNDTARNIRILRGAGVAAN